MNDKLQVGHVGWSPDYGSNKPRHVGWIKLNRMLFIYSLNGVVKCLSAEEIRPVESMMLAAGWKHTATIDPARWIEHMANGNDDPSDMLDELQFSPTNVKEHAPLSAGARVDHGVEVETTEEHGNMAADRGCCVSTCSLSDYQDKAAQNDSFNRGPSLEVSIDKSGGSVSATGATIASSRVIGILDGPSGGVAGSRAVNPRSVVTVNLMVGEHPSLGIGGDTDIPVGVGIATDALHVGINLGDDFGVGHRIDLVLRFLAN